jgi:hypothetical protein
MRGQSPLQELRKSGNGEHGDSARDGSPRAATGRDEGAGTRGQADEGTVPLAGTAEKRQKLGLSQQRPPAPVHPGIQTQMPQQASSFETALVLPRHAAGRQVGRSVTRNGTVENLADHRGRASVRRHLLTSAPPASGALQPSARGLG